MTVHAFEVTGRIVLDLECCKQIDAVQLCEEAKEIRKMCGDKQMLTTIKNQT